MKSVEQSNATAEKSTPTGSDFNGGIDTAPPAAQCGKTGMKRLNKTINPMSRTDNGQATQECNAAEDTASRSRQSGAAGSRWIGVGIFRWVRPANWLIGLVSVYKCAISPWLPPACRFEPSCSMYAMEALRVHGLWRGSWLAVRRLLRCNPFCDGGFDPVPPKNNGNRQTASGSGKMWRDE